VPKEGMPESSYASQAPSQEKVAHRVNYLTYIPVCLSQVKVFEAGCEALRVVAEREKQCRHYVK
jgi:hypothetical protein